MRDNAVRLAIRVYKKLTTAWRHRRRLRPRVHASEGPGVRDGVVIIYRISETGYPKVKPPYINNETCLKNATRAFAASDVRWLVLADSCGPETLEMIARYVEPTAVVSVSVGHGAGTFQAALKAVESVPPDTIVYFLENDYLHRDGAYHALRDGLRFGDYVTLYDHPDKYPNMYEQTDSCHVFAGDHCHWRTAGSTTMTFASRAKTIQEDMRILLCWTQGRHPYDAELFLNLRLKGRVLVSPMPSYSTHGETAFLAPYSDWSSCA